MIALGVDLSVRQSRARGNDAGECAFNQLPGLRRFDLIADGDFDALIEELLNVAVGGMKGDASHGHAVAVGKSDAE